MKKTLVQIAVSTAAILALGMLVSGPAVAKNVAPKVKPAKKESICHVRGNGVYRLISVAKSAIPAHLAHGDAYPGALVLDKYLGDDCSVEETGRVEIVDVPIGPSEWVQVSCPANTTVVGGGYEPLEGAEALAVTVSEAAKPGSGLYPAYPTYTFAGGETGWVVQNGAVEQILTVYAICLPTTP